MQVHFTVVRNKPELVLSCKINDQSQSLIGHICKRRGAPCEFWPNEGVPLQMDEMASILERGQQCQAESV